MWLGCAGLGGMVWGGLVDSFMVRLVWGWSGDCGKIFNIWMDKFLYVRSEQIITQNKKFNLGENKYQASVMSSKLIIATLLQKMSL